MKVLEELKELDKSEWGVLSKRRVKHYGYEFLYSSRDVDFSNPINEIPGFLDFITPKINAELSKFSLDSEN